MAKIYITRRVAINVMITVMLVLLAIFANFITIRSIGRYIIEGIFYDRLSVAYDIGGINGLRSELAKIRTSDKLRYELAVAAEFENKFDSLKDPKNFIDNTLSEIRKKVMLLRNLRSAAFALILAILALRIFLNIRFGRAKKA